MLCIRENTNSYKLDISSITLCCGDTYIFLQSILVATVLMEMFVWLEVPVSMRVEWRYASMISGGQCVMIYGTALMLL